MIDKQDPNKSELILSRNRSLAIKSSGLVKRGLELIDKGKKRRVEVLIGDDSSIGDTISEYIKKNTKDKYDLKIRFNHIGEEILRFAENGEIDIFILNLNNINAGLIPTASDRIEKSLPLSNKIKSTYGKPVIALSGFHGDPYATKGKQASDFFFTMPAKLDDLMEAFEKCLSMISRAKTTPSKAKVTASKIKPKTRKAIKKLLSKGKKQGYLTYDEINEVIPKSLLAPEEIDETLIMFNENDIEVVYEKTKNKLITKKKKTY
jgi:hypothetical protein